MISNCHFSKVPADEHQSLVSHPSLLALGPECPALSPCSLHPGNLLHLPCVHWGELFWEPIWAVFPVDNPIELSLLKNTRFPLIWQLSLGQNLLQLLENKGKEESRHFI